MTHQRTISLFFGGLLGLCLAMSASSQQAPDPASAMTVPTTTEPATADPNTGEPAVVDPTMADAVGTGTQPVTPEHALEDYLDGAVDALLWDHDVPGLVVAVTRADGPELLKGYGHSDVDLDVPVDPERSLFRIGSISKTFIWTSVMLLVERGELDLDRDVNDYLTTFQIEPAFDAPVTLRDLMAHRAGFESSLKIFQTRNDDPRSLGEVLADTQPRRVNPPGSRTSYSNWGSALAAHIVETVSGQPYAEFMQSELLDPLGMRSTIPGPPGQLAGELAEQMTTGLQRKQGQMEAAEVMHIGALTPAGGMASTGADMARWMRFHLNGGALDGVRLLSPATHAQLRTRGFPDRPGAADVAHGFQDLEIRGMAAYGHGGSTGVFLSRMLIVPELDLGMFLSKNAGSEGYATLTMLTGLIIDRELAQRGMTPPVADRAAAVALEEFTGAYRTNRRSFSTFIVLSSLEPSLVVAEHEGALLITLNGNTQRFEALDIEGDLFENERGDRVHFLRDSAGNVVAVNDGSGVHSHERVTRLDAPEAFLLPAGLVLFFALTTWLGKWRRWRQQPERTPQGRRANRLSTLGVLGVLVLVGLAAWMASSLSALTGPASMLQYPTIAVRVFTAYGWVLSGIALLLLFGLKPAWQGSRWGFLRRVNYTVFAASLAVLCVQLYRWNLFGAPLV